MSEFFKNYGDALARAWQSIDEATLEHSAAILLDAYRTGARVFSCGNGGSASIANHLACDHVKGVREGSTLRPKVTSLSSNVELLTAIANDKGYEHVFTYQLESLATEGDVLIVISSSGHSVNVVNAICWAKMCKLSTIALTGFSGAECRKYADVAIHVNSSNYGIIEDVHQAVMHSLAQLIAQAA